MIYFASPGNFPIVRPLFRPFSLSSSHISTNFHTHCFFHKFSSSSVSSSSTSYIHFLSPSRSFQLFGLLFQSIYSVNFLATFSILWVKYLTCLNQFLCRRSPLLVFQPFIYPIFPLLPSFTSLPLRIFHIVGHIFSANFSATSLFSLKCFSQSLPTN